MAKGLVGYQGLSSHDPIPVPTSTLNEYRRRVQAGGTLSWSQLRRIRLKDLELPSLAVTSCENANIHRVADLIGKSRRDLLRLRYFGRKSLKSIREAVAPFGVEIPD